MKILSAFLFFVMICMCARDLLGDKGRERLIRRALCQLKMARAEGGDAEIDAARRVYQLSKRTGHRPLPVVNEDPAEQ
jgi:hypothetical protein